MLALHALDKISVSSLDHPGQPIANPEAPIREQFAEFNLEGGIYELNPADERNADALEHLKAGSSRRTFDLYLEFLKPWHEKYLHIPKKNRCIVQLKLVGITKTVDKVVDIGVDRSIRTAVLKSTNHTQTFPALEKATIKLRNGKIVSVNSKVTPFEHYTVQMAFRKPHVEISESALLHNGSAGDANHEEDHKLGQISTEELAHRLTSSPSFDSPAESANDSHPSPPPPEDDGLAERCGIDFMGTPANEQQSSHPPTANKSLTEQLVDLEVIHVAEDGHLQHTIKTSTTTEIKDFSIPTVIEPDESILTAIDDGESVNTAASALELDDSIMTAIEADDSIMKATEANDSVATALDEEYIERTCLEFGKSAQSNGNFSVATAVGQKDDGGIASESIFSSIHHIILAVIFSVVTFLLLDMLVGATHGGDMLTATENAFSYYSAMIAGWFSSRS